MIKFHTLQVKQTFHPKFQTIIWHKTGGRNDLVGDTQSANVFLPIISTNEIKGGLQTVVECEEAIKY